MTEVAHDFNSQVRKIVEESGMKNSFDTWHGTYTSMVIVVVMVMLYYIVYCRH